jgi:ribonuclease-3
LRTAILNRLFGKQKKLSNSKLANLSDLLGYKPGNFALYEQAFRHNSYVGEVSKEQGLLMSNERLEFLGDAVLSCVVAEVLFLTYPTKDEGFLTETRSKVVSRAMLGDLAVKLGLDGLIQHSKGLNQNRQVMKSLSGNALEALLGAIYLDKGFKFTRNFIHKRLLNGYLDIYELAKIEVNFKSRLIEWAQKMRKEIAFELAEEKQGRMSKSYVIVVKIDGTEMGRAEDFSKKKAEQEAAKMACQKAQIIES